MRIGYYLSSLVEYQFKEIQGDSGLEDLNNNLQVLHRLLQELPRDVGVLVFSFYSPFWSNSLEGPNPLGFFEDQLKEIKKIVVEKNLRFVSIFHDAWCGLAQRGPLLEKVSQAILRHTEFYELMQLDYSNLIFIPYGGAYEGDHRRFFESFRHLPTYVQQRLGIYDRGNLESMSLAEKGRWPWIYNLSRVPFQKGLIEKSKLSFKEHSLFPGNRTLLTCTFSLANAIREGLDQEDVDVILSSEKVTFNQPTLKLKLKANNAPTANLS